MKTVFLIHLFCLCGVLCLYAQEKKEQEKYLAGVEVSNRQAGIGIQYIFRERWRFPFVAGICNEFNERKWNDWYMTLQPYYLCGKGRLRFPIGILGGIRGISDYGHHFRTFFCGGYTGLHWQWGKQAVEFHIGGKYGKYSHLLHRSSGWGEVAAYETYRERPVFFTVGYQYHF